MGKIFFKLFAKLDMTVDRFSDRLIAARREYEGEPVVVVPRKKILEWRAEWLAENDPQDGTDCVTPFDEVLY